MVPITALGILVVFVDGRKESVHDADDGMGGSVPLITVLDGHGIVHHVLDVAAVFRHLQFFEMCVVGEHVRDVCENKFKRVGNMLLPTALYTM